jgi:hypothetical protein
MKKIIFLILILTFAGCGIFEKTPTKRLASDTTVTVYRNYLYKSGEGSQVFIYLPKHYKVNVYNGPDFDVENYYFNSSDSSDGYIGGAGEYEGMSAQQSGREEGEVFVESLFDTLKTGRIQKWNIYHGLNGWALRTDDRLYKWAFGSTHQSLILWKEILDSKQSEPGK